MGASCGGSGGGQPVPEGRSSPASPASPASRSRRASDGGRRYRSGTGSPLTQAREGCSHRITAAAATREVAKPPVTKPRRNSGTARTVSANRAERLRCITCQPRMAVAAASAPVTVASRRTTSRTEVTSRSSACSGGFASSSSRPRRVSRESREPIWANTERITRTDPRIVTQPAIVTWRGRSWGFGTAPFQQTAGCAPRPASYAGCRSCPGHAPPTPGPSGWTGTGMMGGCSRTPSATAAPPP